MNSRWQNHVEQVVWVMGELNNYTGFSGSSTCLSTLELKTKLVKIVRGYTLISWMTTFTWNYVRGVNSCLIGNAKNTGLVKNGSLNGDGDNAESKTWCPSHILDFSNLSIGDPIYDLIPLYLDIFRGDCCLLKRFLESYKLPLVRRASPDEYVEGGDKFGRLSYHAMCYCILHEENVLGAIFSLWDELKMAKSWEEVEQLVWGELNNYNGFPESSTFLSSLETTTPTTF